MGFPVVIATNGFGIPVTEVPEGTPGATPYEIADNGFGTPVVFVASGGLPLTKGGGVSRFASTVNQMHGTTIALDSVAKTGFFQRWPAFYPNKQSMLKPRFHGAWVSLNSSTGLLTDLGNALNILDIVALFPNGTTVQLKVGGVNSRRIANGENSVAIDDITPSAAGYVGEFPANMLVWYTFRGTVDQVNDKLPRTERLVQEVTGSQSLFYDPAATTITNMGTGAAATWSGTTPSSSVWGMQLWHLGTPVASTDVALGGFIDSITANQGDQIEAAPAGRGWFQRMVGALNIPSANFAVPGATTLMGKDDDRMSFWYKFLTDALFYGGTNDFGTAAGTGGNLQTSDTVRARIRARRDQMKAAGVRKVGIVRLGVVAEKGTGTNGVNNESSTWATEAGQVPIWDATTQVKVFNDNVASDDYDFLVPNDANRGVDPEKWAVTGAANGRAADKVHPSRGGHVALANEARVITAAALGISAGSVIT